MSSPSNTLTLSLDLQPGLSAEETERRALAGHRAKDLGCLVAAFYLADLVDRNLHERLGYATPGQYAKQRMRMKYKTFREYVRVGRALRDLPDLQRRFASDELRWSQLRALTRVVTPETERAWGEWATTQTVEETRRQAKARDKGDLPTDPTRRRIHTTKLRVGGTLNATQIRVWELLRQGLEANEFTGPASDVEMMMWLAHKAVKEFFGGDSLSLTQPNPDLDPANQGAPLPLEQRPPKTGKSLQRKVVERDNGACACCSSTHNLSAHHIKWRRYGGPTVPGNLITLCEGCHSLVHDRFLILRGGAGDLLFLGTDGKELGSRTVPLMYEVGSPRGDEVGSPPRPKRVSFNDVPRVVDADWWRRHRHLFDYRRRQGFLEFEPGFASAAEPLEGTIVARERAGGRDQGLDTLVGQERVRESLRVAVRSSQVSGEQLGHVLLLGAPGLGKTSLARAVADELGGRLESILAPVIQDPSVLVSQVSSLEPGTVLFLDEVHRLSTRSKEVLYEALERNEIDLPIRCGSAQRTLTIQLVPFTLIAATTEEGLLPEPFRSRFVHQERLEFYDWPALGKIVDNAMSRKELGLTPAARDLVVGASRDTPRVALSIVQAVSDEVRVKGRAGGDLSLVASALKRTGRSTNGLTAGESNYLRSLHEAGGRAGLSTLASKLGSSRRSIEHSLEPFLLRRGMVRTTPRGRCLTQAGRAALGLGGIQSVAA